MAKNRNRNRNRARRERSVLDEPLPFWRDGDGFAEGLPPVATVRRYDDLTLLDEKYDAEWARALTKSTLPPLRPLPKVGSGEWMERFLWHPRRRFPDWDWVTDDVSTGGFVKNKDEAEALVEAGVTHVINTASEWPEEKKVFKGLPIEYYFNPVLDDYRWKDPEWFNRTLDFALPVIAQGGHVYIHCLEGINRGPSSAYAVLRAQGMSIKDAKAAITDVRPKAKVRYALDAEAAREEVSS